MVTASVRKGVEVIYDKNSCFSKDERARYLRWQQRLLAARSASPSLFLCAAISRTPAALPRGVPRWAQPAHGRLKCCVAVPQQP